MLEVRIVSFKQLTGAVIVLQVPWGEAKWKTSSQEFDYEIVNLCI